MSVPQIFALSCIEIVGDFALKSYANNGGITNLGIGIIGYVGVVFMLGAYKLTNISQTPNAGK